MVGKGLQALLAEFLFAGIFFGADKGPRQNDSVFNQIGHIEHQSATAGFAVHHRKAMRNAEHP